MKKASDFIESKKIFFPKKIRLIGKSVESRFGWKPKFAILSTGRAGSTYTAKLLSQIGLRCGHERFFTPNGFYKSFRYDGDSSWLAVPYLEANRNLCGEVFHQIRHPLDVISSLYGINFFNSDNTGNQFYLFCRENFNVTGDELISCVKFWTEWNIRCERLASYSYTFENLLRDPSILIDRINGGAFYKEKQEVNIAGKVNARRRVEISLSDIPDCSEKRAMVSLAHHYGYDI